MVKKISFFLLGLFFSCSINASNPCSTNALNLTISDSEIIARANTYKEQALSLSKSQTDSSCNEVLSESSNLLSCIPMAIKENDKPSAKFLALYAQNYAHYAILQSCLRLDEIRILESNIIQLYVDL